MESNELERRIQHDVLAAWGAHPRLRMARVNTGVGWFAHGAPARKSDPGAYPVRFNPKGTADIVGLMAPTGRLFMLECKTATGTQTKEQRSMMLIVRAFGGFYAVVRSLADADEALTPLVGPR